MLTYKLCSNRWKGKSTKKPKMALQFHEIFVNIYQYSDIWSKYVYAIIYNPQKDSFFNINLRNNPEDTKGNDDLENETKIPSVPKHYCWEQQLLFQKQKYITLTSHGGRSSVGRAQDCGSCGRGFDSRRSPHYEELIRISQTAKHALRVFLFALVRYIATMRLLCLSHRILL